ncbi:MAG: HAD-IC family P-type ATPase [Bdellovibrionales bacterium]|nr:HAD-IC family P-type ATPase [Bdellovibrionales bacterium]
MTDYLSAEEALHRLHSDASLGLPRELASRRLREHGYNELPEPRREALARIFLRQFLSPLIYLLFLAAAISFVIGHREDAWVILMVVFLNSIVGAVQEGRAEQSLTALRRLSRLKARVVRGGTETEIEARELVPGDVILVAAGDAVPADAFLLEATALTAAEAALTGESAPVLKRQGVLPRDTPLADRSNVIHAGTWVASGRGRALVVASGMGNEIGKIARMATQGSRQKTRLELKVQEFGRTIALAAVALFGLVIGVGLLRGVEFSEIFMIAVSQTVSLVPEGLPVALTVALAVGVQRMAQRRTVVRKLTAVETLGSTNVICTDKTGTLTRNEMTVVEVWSASSGERGVVTGIGYRPEGSTSVRDEELYRAVALCNDARLAAPEDPGAEWKAVGDPTEAALLTLAVKGGLDPETLRREWPRTAEIPFDADVKMMATQHDAPGGGVVVYLKGAPEELLALGDHPRVREVASSMAEKALRVLGVARARGQPIHGESGYAAFRGKLEWLGLVGEIDPPRPEAARAVAECMAAGVRPVMVTGDHKATAWAIAREVGIPGAHAVDGTELERMPEEELDRRIEDVGVFARVHPAQKLRIVQAWQRRRRVVAMTGDGVNDAPALAKADVGVAMGITGTEVAKEASKIVITDDNFSTLVAAVAEGRLVYGNIRKLILFLFVTSIDEVAVLLLALFSGYPPPLAAVQILWINLVSEGALTLNLIMEPAEGDEMRRGPRPIDEPLLGRDLLARMPLMVGASVASVFGWFFWRTHQGADPAVVQTETFTVLVVSQWFNALNCRSATKSTLSRDILRNPWLLGGLFLANVLHFLVVYWDPLARFFRTVPIEPFQFFAIGAVASLVLWAEEARKWRVRSRGSRSSR